MSYILDALKKSELERHSPARVRPTPTVNASVSVKPRPAAAPAVTREAGNERKIGRWYWIIGGALVINGAFTLFHHYNDPRHTGAGPQAEAETTAAPVAEPAKLAQAATRATRPVAAAPVGSTQRDNEAPLLKDKPAAYRHSVPKMNVDLHVYAQRPSERFALINMTKFREGDEIGHGLSLQQITPTGLIIAFQGETFRIDTRY